MRREDHAAALADVVARVAHHQRPRLIHAVDGPASERVAERDGRHDVRGRFWVELRRRVVHEHRTLGVARDDDPRVGAVGRQGFDDVCPVFTILVLVSKLLSLFLLFVSSWI